MIFNIAYEYLWLVSRGVTEKERTSRERYAMENKLKDDLLESPLSVCSKTALK